MGGWERARAKDEGAEGIAVLDDDHPTLYAKSKSFWPVRDIIIAGAQTAVGRTLPS
jgi:hypothetical protein